MKIASVLTAALLFAALLIFSPGLLAQATPKYQPLSSAEKHALQEAEPAPEISAGAVQKKYSGFTKAELRELVKQDCPALYELSAGGHLHDWHWSLIGVGIALGTLLLIWPILLLLAVI